MDKQVGLSAAAFLLLAVVIFMYCLHVAFGRQKRRREQNQAGGSSIAADTDLLRGDVAVTVSWKGLDKSVVEALPTFIYRCSGKGKDVFLPQREASGPSVEKQMMDGLGSNEMNHDNNGTSSDSGLPILECPVCLSEFAEGERGRLLPSCKHRFHVECIDTWLLSSGTCPVCRAGCGVHEEAAVEVTRAGTGVVQYPTNVLFWGSNSVLASSRASLNQYPTIHILSTQPPPPSPPRQPEAATPSTSSRISRLNPLRRLLSRESIPTDVAVYSKV